MTYLDYNLSSLNTFQNRAADLALKALTCGYVDHDDLGGVKSSLIKSIGGKSITLKQNPKQKYQQLITYFKDLACQSTPSVLEHNCKLFADGLKLPDFAWKIFELVVVLKTNKGLDSFIEHVTPSDYSNDMFAQIIGIEHEDLINFLFTLNEIGLFDCLHLEISSSTLLPLEVIKRLAQDKAYSYSELIAPIIELLPASALSLQDFSYLKIDHLQQFLDIAVNNSMTGVNMLFYGEPGVGKTELAKALADNIAANLIEIKPKGADVHYQEQSLKSSNQGSLLRMQYLKLVEQLTCANEKNILLIDECNSLFEQAMSLRGVGKDVIQNLLEGNRIPSLWITNNIDALPASCIRRFSFVKHIEVPDNRIMENLINKATKGLRLFKSFKTMLAAKQHVTPANITNATFVCRTLGLTGKQAEANIINMVDETLSACGFEEHKVQYKPQLPFNIESLNIQGGNKAINQIARAVNKNGDVRVLLTGPPGTGKTAVVNHLAEQANKELITVRCSDVLDKYVGGSEKNIARLFREAGEKEAILFFDEIDSLLQDRSGMSQSFEVQQVNELLTQIECFNQPFFAATNFSTGLDKAVMRRFDFKLHFEYLTSPQVLTLYNRLLGKLMLPDKIRKELATLKLLTPGDFAILARRQKISTSKLSHSECLEILTTENNRKQQTKAIGFIN